MRYLKMLGLAALSAMALVVFVGAGSASATTLEVGGTTKNETITITASLKIGTSAKLESTLGIGANTCSQTHVHIHISLTTGPKVTGPVEGLTIGNCDHTVTVHNKGQLYIEHIPGTTNGRVYSEGAEITTYSTIHGTHINCTTGAGTQIGTLTGVASGQAELHVNAVIDCGSGHISSARWTATYTVASPTGLGVSA